MARCRAGQLETPHRHWQASARAAGLPDGPGLGGRPGNRAHWQPAGRARAPWLSGGTVTAVPPRTGSASAARTSGTASRRRLLLVCQPPESEKS